MDHNQLLSSTVELGLELLEKNGSFLPFCEAVNDAGETFVYTPDSESNFSVEQAFESVRLSVQRDLHSRHLKGVAFCLHSRVRLSDSRKKVPAIEVELHYRGVPASVWYFTYKLDQNKATVIHYYTNDATDDLFA